jgi:glycogen operon protein
MAVALNAGDSPVTVRLPDAREGRVWRHCIDTSVPSGRPDAVPVDADESTAVASRSVVVLAEAVGSATRRQRSGVEPEVLERLGAAAGIARDWWDVAGEHHVVAPDTTRALLAAMGLAAESSGEARDRLVELANARERRRLPALVLAREGCTATVAIAELDEWQRHPDALRLRREDGTEQILPFTFDDLAVNVVSGADARPVAQRILTLPPLPAGAHTLVIDDGTGVQCRVVVAPERCFLPREIREGARRFGLAAHLYSLRRRGDQGIGDFTTLSLLGETTARAGGSIVGINPLHALFAEDRQRASPYHPSDRRFLDPIYIDVERVPDLSASRDARSLLEQYGPRVANLSLRSDVDYAAVWEIKRAVLAACFAQFERRPDADAIVAEFDRFVAGGGLPLMQFAVFEAIAAARPREPWHGWPDDLRRPDASGVADFAGRQSRRVRFALYLQWLADRQLAAAAGHARGSGLVLGFFRDLAIGAAPDGAESWANPDAFAHGVSIGAPPDPFSPAGQIWNLPPPNPQAMTASACAGFRDLLAANMRHAGALRIDHVMGLSRLFWIPEGATAAEGTYVDYPLEALLGVLALESVRARCLVVGEDLGTVPEGLRERLAATDVLSCRMLWFERDGAGFIAPSRYPVKAAACVTTHDLPTIAGWWAGADIDEKQSLGLLTADAAESAHTERRASREALADALERSGATPGARVNGTAAHDDAITAAVHRFVCASASALVMMQADDLAGETTAVNLPGTDRVRPNWRRKVAIDVEALWQTEAGAQAIADFAPVRTGR